MACFIGLPFPSNDRLHRRASRRQHIPAITCDKSVEECQFTPSSEKPRISAGLDIRGCRLTQASRDVGEGWWAWRGIREDGAGRILDPCAAAAGVVEVLE